MTWEGAPLGKLVFDRTYSRIKQDGSNETWDECVERVVDGNLNLVDEKYIRKNEREELIELISKKALLPAGRSLWMSGVEGRQYLANCFVAPWETPSRHFGFMFGELMKGGGVGANYSQRHVESLDMVVSVPQVAFTCSMDHPDYSTIAPYMETCWYDYYDGLTELYVKVPDSREGWVDALTTLLDVASGKEHVDYIVFDVSSIRGKGQPIKTFGGVAAGPEPLVLLLRGVLEILKDQVGHQWTARSAMSIDHQIAQAVVAGNVRRSARMSILRWDDPEIDWFLDCKRDHLDHWSTNISVEVDWAFFDQLSNPLSEARRVFERVIDGMLRDGEPGFFNSQLASEGEPEYVDTTNPCGEIALQPGEPCVLGHVNLAYPWRDENELLDGFELMSRFLLRATFMDTTDPLTMRVLRQNRRIGCGFLGLQEMLASDQIRLSDVESSDLPFRMLQWKNEVRRAANEYAAELGINAPVKVTTVAPTGSISNLAGTSSGIQAIFSPYYIRRVRYAEGDANIPADVILEKDIYSANTVVASFPTKDAVAERVGDEYLEGQYDISPLALCKLQAVVQGWYADNAISHTINIRPDQDRKELADAIMKYLPMLKGITVFPSQNRPQLPFEAITREQYESMTGKSIGQAEVECGPVGCPIR